MRAGILVFLALSGCMTPAPSPAPDESTLEALSCAPCRNLLVTAPFGLREPALAVHPEDPERLLATSMGFEVVANAAGRLRLALHASEDGGRTWRALPNGFPGATPATETYDGTPLFLPDGTALVGGIALEGAYSMMGPVQGNARAFAWRLDDGKVATIADGQGAEVMALGIGAALRAPDKPALAVAPDGALLAAYIVRERQGADSALTFEVARSADGGRTWTPAGVPSAEGVPGAIVSTPFGWAMSYLTFERFEDIAERRYTCWLATTDARASTWSARELGACNGFPALAARGDELLVALPRERELVLLEGERSTTVHAAAGAFESIPALLALDTGALVTYYRPGSGGSAYEAARVDDGRVIARLTLEDGIERKPGALGEYFGLVRAGDAAVATWVGEEPDGVAIVSARIDGL